MVVMCHRECDTGEFVAAVNNTQIRIGYFVIATAVESAPRCSELCGMRRDPTTDSRIFVLLSISAAKSRNMIAYKLNYNMGYIIFFYSFDSQ